MHGLRRANTGRAVAPKPLPFLPCQTPQRRQEAVVTIPCPDCDAYPEPCPTCDGEGRVEVRMSHAAAEWHARMDAAPAFAAAEWSRLQRASRPESLRADAGTSPASRSAEPATTTGGCVESVAPGPA